MPSSMRSKYMCWQWMLMRFMNESGIHSTSSSTLSLDPMLALLLES